MATERAAAARQLSDIDARLTREAEARAALEQTLTLAEASHHEATTRHASELTAAAAHLAAREASFEAGLAEVASARDALAQTLTASQAALQQSEQQRNSEAAAAAEDLARHQAAFATRIADVARSRDTLAQRLSDATATLDEVRQAHAAATEAAADRLAQRENELGALLAQSSDARISLEQQLADSAAARQLADERATAELAAIAQQLTDVDARLTLETETRTALEQTRASLEQQLADAASARQLADQRAATELAAVTQQLTDVNARLTLETETRTALEQTRASLEQQLADAASARQLADERAATELATVTQQLTDVEARLAQETEARTALDEARASLEQQLADAAGARQLADQRAATELAAVTQQLTDVETRLTQETETRIALEQTRTSLEQRLADAAAARQLADQRAATELAAVTQQLTDVEARLTQETETRTALEQTRASLEQQLADAVAARQLADRQAASDQEAAAQRLAAVAARLAEEIEARTDLEKTRDALERQLADGAAARQLADERAASDRAAAAQRLADVEARLAQETETRAGVEQQLSNAHARHRESEERHQSDQATAAAYLTECQAQFDSRLSQISSARDAVERQLLATTAALEQTQQDREAETVAAASRLAEREAELGAKLADAAQTRAALDQQLADAEAARQLADERAFADQTTAARTVADLEARLARETETRTTLEHDLAIMGVAAEHARQQAHEEMAALRHLMAEHEARLEQQAVEERAWYERLVTNGQQQLRQLRLEREALQHALETAQEGLLRLTRALDEERRSHAQDRQTAESEQSRLAGEYDDLQRTLEAVRADFQALAQVASDHAAEVARLGTVVSARDAQLQQLTAQHLSSQQAAKDALSDLEAKLHAAVEIGKRSVAELQAKLAALGGELAQTSSDRDALRITAERLPQVQQQLDDNLADARRHLEHTPYGICRVNREGALVQANRGLVRLLGYRTTDELLAVDLAGRVFESGDDLRWLIERCVSTSAAETAETTWKRKDGGRRIVKLLAFNAGTDAIEMVAEDVTDLRTVEERLRQAQRMEAVGRLAPEVAVTCDHLLRDVSDEGQQWLAAMDHDADLRQQGERLLSEVKRAASFLRQLAVYGEQQTTALEPVNVNQVLRGLEPVLKLVAGDNIDIVLPTAPRAINVDVAVDRLERILVNVASYARQRMPFGGRVKIEIDRVAVDRRFVAKSPHVRPGAHALMTVTEEHGRKTQEPPMPHRAATGEPDASRSVGDKPGVDVGVLLELIGKSGGHLWMAAEPSGNMVLKIHLPQGVSDGLTEAHPPASRSVGERAMARLFRH